jgi:hypothetical protein
LRIRFHANLVRQNIAGTEADCVLLLSRVKEPGVLLFDACTRMLVRGATELRNDTEWTGGLR